MLLHYAVPNIRDACKMVADRTIGKATKQELNLPQATKAYGSPTSIAVSTDGFWMKRGHTSLFGTGAVIGVRSEKYENYVNNHRSECSASHERSSGKIEVTHTLEIFERSVKKQTEGFGTSQQRTTRIWNLTGKVID